MDILKEEIAKKRKLLEDSKLIGCDKKYFKRADLVNKELEEYKAKYGPTINKVSNSTTKNDEGFVYRTIN